VGTGKAFAIDGGAGGQVVGVLVAGKPEQAQEAVEDCGWVGWRLRGIGVEAPQVDEQDPGEGPLAEEDVPGVNRVWSGGSMSRMPWLIRCQNGSSEGSGGRCPISSCVAVCRYVLPNRRSRSSELTSAYRVTSQWSVASSYSTDACSRSRSYAGYGSATNEMSSGSNPSERGSAPSTSLR
jgi:hypothetical protein